MKSDEEVAKEAAEAFITPDTSMSGPAWGVGEGQDARSLTGLPEVAARLKASLAGLVLAAIREAVRQVPGEPPVSAKDIDGIGGVNVTAGWNNTSAQWAIDKLLTQLAHYERLTALLLRDEAGVAYAEGLAEGRRLGWEAGALAQREADVAAVADDAEYVGDIRLTSGKRFAERLSDLPLTDPS